MTTTLCIPASDCPQFTMFNDRATGRQTLRINAAVGDAHCYVELDLDGLAALRRAVEEAWREAGIHDTPLNVAGELAQAALFSDLLRQVAEPQHHNAACDGGNHNSK